jgi:hypothetical protein
LLGLITETINMLATFPVLGTNEAGAEIAIEGKRSSEKKKNKKHKTKEHRHRSKSRKKKRDRKQHDDEQTNTLGDIDGISSNFSPQAAATLHLGDTIGFRSVNAPLDGITAASPVHAQEQQLNERAFTHSVTKVTPAIQTTAKPKFVIKADTIDDLERIALAYDTNNDGLFSFVEVKQIITKYVHDLKSRRGSRVAGMASMEAAGKVQDSAAR